jgi:hypothetical protein
MIFQKTAVSLICLAFKLSCTGLTQHETQLTLSPIRAFLCHPEPLVLMNVAVDYLSTTVNGEGSRR